MSPIWIVLKNEFLKRVKSRWFILTTLLGPIAFVGFMLVVGFAAAGAMESGEKRVAVIDETGVLFERIARTSDEQVQYIDFSEPEDSARAAVLSGDLSGYLLLPEGIIETSEEADYFSTEGGFGGFFSGRLESTVERAVTDHRLEQAEVSPEVQSIFASAGDVDVRSVRLTSEGEEAGDAGAYAIIGFIMGFLIYLAMLIYGSVVMQGVIEEKLSRVVEIIVSSVRPFQLLMGKVLGIGAMGLVQMVVWALLIMAGTMFSGTIIALFLDPANLDLPVDATNQQVLEAVDFQVPQLGPEVFIWFVLFFLVGYLLYASLFAAIGSAVEQQQDAQGLMLPVMMPIILSIVFIQPIIEAPNSPLAVALSIIPFFSPIPMVVRIAVSDVPFWQVGLSFTLLVAAFIGAVWVSARIYRVGVLMYGKKAKLRDLIRWIRYA